MQNVSEPVQVLSQPLRLASGSVARNRLVKVSLSENLSSSGGGRVPNELYQNLYAEFASGGWGMIFTGNVMVDPKHAGSPWDLYLPQYPLSPQDLKPWQRYASTIKSGGALAIAQIVHTGRQSPRGCGRLPWKPCLGFSSIRVDPGSNFLARLMGRVLFNVPKEMDQNDFDTVRSQFVNSARSAMQAGFDGIELHCSHGYLLASGLSPKTNKRTDIYGGSPENRIRFILEIIEQIRFLCPHPFVLGVKLNSADYVKGGLTEEDAIENVRSIVSQGLIDFIEISGGTYENPYFIGSKSPSLKDSTRAREGFFRNFSTRVKANLGANSSIAVLLTGGLRSREGMASVISSSTADFIGIGRPSCLYPHLPDSSLLNPSISDVDAQLADPDIPCLSILKRLIPVILASAGFETLWYASQLHRIARGMKPNFRASIPSQILLMMLGPAGWLKLLLLTTIPVAIAYWFQE